jgi:hypothetical protein
LERVTDDQVRPAKLPIDNTMDPTMRVQTQIRKNAEEVSTFLSELSKWEKQVKVKDECLKSKRPTFIASNTPLDDDVNSTGAYTRS